MHKQDVPLTATVNWHSRCLYCDFVALSTAAGWSISLIQLQMTKCVAGQRYADSNPSVYKRSVCELMVIPESQIGAYFSIC